MFGLFRNEITTENLEGTASNILVFVITLHDDSSPLVGLVDNLYRPIEDLELTSGNAAYVSYVFSFSSKFSLNTSSSG